MLRRRLTLTLTVLVVALLLASYPMTAEADHTADKINKCRTIDQSGSYALDRNLQATGDCLVIATNNVTVDLAGYTITGDGTGAGVRVLGNTTQFSAITLRNGTVTNFGLGVVLFGRHHVVDGVRSIDNNSDGIVLNGISPAGNTVRNSIASGNGKHPSILASGIVVRGSGNSVIGNVANGNDEEGISVTCPSTIVNNIATGNGFGDIVTIPEPPAMPLCTRLGNSPLP